MQITHGRVPTSVQPGTAYAPHIGQVLLDAVLSADGVFVNDAMYAPCARTSWHTHEAGQLIFVTAGRGVVATREGEVQIVGKGDVVHTPPGEEHWHGAAPNCFVTYTSVSLGSTETLDAVLDGEYSPVWT